MISRFARLCLLAASSAIALDALAQNPPPLPTNPPAQGPNAPTPAAAPGQPTRMQPAVTPAPGDDEVRLMLPDADIDTVITTLENLTGRIVLRPQQLQTTTYNIKIDKRIPKAEAILAIETVLALNNLGLSALGDRFLKLVNLQSVRQEAPEMISGSAFDYPASGRAATKLFQLEFARAQEVSGLLTNMLNPFYGNPVPLLAANALLITDSISNLQRVEKVLEQLDRPNLSGMKPKFYPLSEVKASDVVNKIRAVLTGSLQQQIGGGVSFSADDRTNQIILVADPRQYPFFDDLIERLNQRADPNMRNDVINLKHAKSKEVVDVIGNIIRGQATAARQNSGSVRPGMMPTPAAPAVPGAPPAPTPVAISAATNSGDGSNEFSSLMTVVSDDRSNSVVVSGTADDIRLVRSLIDKLDITLAQVRIEVVIAEVSLSDASSTGISELGLVLQGDKLVGFSGVLSESSFVTSNGTLTRPGASGAWDLAATIAIKATPRKSNSTIMSVPAIVTSHGKKAKVFNGETRPVITGTVQSGVGGGTSGLASSSTVTQQQIGTNLTVTPFIGIDGSVQLEILQTVEEVTERVEIDGNQQYVIGRRETESYVTAKSGEIIVLGGFQKTIDRKSSSRLGPIPFLGDLFGSRSKERGRQELIFFLRPYVLTNNAAVDNVETLKRLERLPTRDDIKQQLYPDYKPANPSALDKVLPH
ncbi:MAG: secretin N-terminal domain-containing protein [Verrucomicrobiota bacterium]